MWIGRHCRQKRRENVDSARISVKKITRFLSFLKICRRALPEILDCAIITDIKEKGIYRMKVLGKVIICYERIFAEI